MMPRNAAGDLPLAFIGYDDQGNAQYSYPEPKAPPPSVSLSSTSGDISKAKAEMLGEARSKSGFVSGVSTRAMLDVAPISPTRVVRPDAGPLPGVPHTSRSPLPTVRPVTTAVVPVMPNPSSPVPP